MSQIQALTPESSFPLQTPPVTGALDERHELVFLDTSLAGWQTLRAGIDSSVEVILLDSTRDGLLQIAAALQERTGLDAIHIYSHGGAGQLTLGNATLSLATLEHYTQELQILGQSLKDTGDLLLYGCNVAQGDVGQTFMQAMARMTHADIAASDDLTGASSLGGDWILEQNVGSIETLNPLSQAAQQSYTATLATISGDDNPNTLTGTEGDDLILGFGGNDSLFGLGGNDTLDGGAGFNFLSGGDGNDLLIGGADGNSMDGGAGDDTLNGGAGFNFLSGGDGNDQLNGGAGSDFLNGGAGDDLLNGGAGNDTADYSDAGSAVTVNLTNLAAQDTGGAGIDTLVNIENLDGSAFNDIFTGDGANNTFFGNGGNDQLTGGAGADQLFGGAGDDSLVGGTGDDNLDGSDGNDQLTGGAGDDLLDGGPGDDTLDGGAGDDTADYSGASSAVTVDLAILVAQNTGGAGTDTLSNIENLRGSGFNDIFNGNGADNSLTGAAGNDSLGGGEGDDTLDGGAGDDTLDGGLGKDTVSYLSYFNSQPGDAGKVGVTVDLNVLAAQNTNGAGNDILSGIENLQGSFLNDTLTGDSADNVLDGSSGNDLLVGGAGNDTLIGGSGDDTLYGGEGNDVLNGGDGNDTASYVNSAVSVTANLSPAAVNIAGQGVDTRTSIENLQGSDFNDILIGNDKDNVLTGGTGNDRLIGGAGNDLLIGGDGNDLLIGGAGNDTLDGGAGNDTLDGGIGNDTASYADATSAVTVNLAILTAQDTGGAGTDTLKNIENLQGSAFNDSLTGDSKDNILEGLNGDDTLDGGAGSDTAFYATALSAVTINLSTQTVQVTGGAGNDTLLNIENLHGTNFNDTLIGDFNNNGFEGDDGNDFLDGGSGNDTAIYASAGTGVTVSLFLQNQTQDTKGAGIDNLNGFENLVGSAFGDNLTGDDSDNTLDGGGGDDVLTGGSGGGNDLYIGGDGNDTVKYSSATQTIAVNLITHTAQGADIGSDRLASIENIIGGAGNDTLTGDGKDNIIEGGTGDDTQDGGAGSDTASYADAASAVTVSLAVFGAQNTVGAGNDTLSNFENLRGSGFDDTLTGDGKDNVLEGLKGDDTLDGGSGEDTASYANVVNASGDFTTNGVTVDLNIAGAQNTQKAGLDVLQSIEHLLGSNLDDTLTGNSGANRLTGGNGQDSLLGGAGNDTLDGGSGNDTLDGGSGNDSMIGGAGNDTYRVDSAQDIVVEKAGEGTDTIETTVNLGALPKGVEIIHLLGSAATGIGNTGNNTLQGNDVANRLDGSVGDDALQGGLGDDTLIGGLGADTLEGGLGNDTLTGGAGKDVFRFVTVGEGADRFTDFATKQDKIQVVSANFGNLAVGTLSAGNFVLNGAATGAAPTFLYDGTTGALSFDLDGSGVGAAVQIATLTGPKTLAATDIQIVAG